MKRRGRKDFKDGIERHDPNSERHNVLTHALMDIRYSSELESEMLKLRRPTSAIERKQYKNSRMLNAMILHMHDLQLEKEFQKLLPKME